MKEKDMKRILVRKEKEREDVRLEALKKRIQESKRKRLRESGRTEVDLKALREVQEQFDRLIKDLTSAKGLLAGLAIGANEVSYDNEEEIS
jgi:hypothetical protein